MKSGCLKVKRSNFVEKLSSNLLESNGNSATQSTNDTSFVILAFTLCLSTLSNCTLIFTGNPSEVSIDPRETPEDTIQSRNRIPPEGGAARARG